jgi:hypothetical protein
LQVIREQGDRGAFIKVSFAEANVHIMPSVLVLHGRSDVDLNLDIWPVLVEGRQAGNQQMACKRGWHSHAQAQTGRFHPGEVSQPVKGFTYTRKGALAGCRQAHTRGRPLEKLLSQLGLEQSDPVTHCAGRDAQLDGRLREAPQSGRAFKGSQGMDGGKSVQSDHFSEQRKKANESNHRR